MKKVLLATSLIASSFSAFAADLTVEELRIEKASKAMPKVLNAFADEVNQFEKQWQATTSYQQASDLIDDYAKQLWRDAKARIIKTNSFDDRELYWARLLSSKIIRTSKPKFAMTDSEQTALLTRLENGSRGRTELDYSKKTDKRILITGFDPFLLDKNINQSNPSGVAALLLDGQVINYKGISAEINTVMVPVRYEDFDQGIIESLFAPYYALNNVDMIATISMGREDFDLERFPGKRRSVTAPDNANIIYGGTATAPKVSSLNDRPLPGNEFVLFSLPVKQMQQAKGPFIINDNHKVVTLEKAFEPKSGRQLTVYSDQPSLVFYTANYIDGSQIGKGDFIYQKHGAFCFEPLRLATQHSGANINNTLLQPETPFYSKTRWFFTHSD